MKKVERKLNKAQLITVWLLIASILLTGVYFVFIAIAKKKAASNSGTSSKPAIIDLMEGESLSSTNSPLAYPSVSESEITFIDISNAKNNEKFGVIRQPDANGNLTGSFLFHYYEEGSETFDTYLPPIISEDGAFEYSDLFAIEGNDGFNTIYYITYLCSALGNPLFSERIELPTEDTPEAKAKSDALHRDYGLTKSESTRVVFTYTKKDPATNQMVEGKHEVIIGGKALSGAGFYFKVDGRPYVYYTNSEYFSYAIKSFSNYIRGVLVSKGIAQDSVYGPYLTTNFTSWTSTKYGTGKKIFFPTDKTKYQNPTIVVNGSYTETGANGYTTGTGIFAFDTESHKWRTHLTSLQRIFNDKKVGTYSDPIVFTLLKDLSDSESRIIAFGNSTTVTYEYKITKIEAVMKDGSEITSGNIGADATVLKVTYTAKVGDVSRDDCHAILDLAKLDAETQASIRAQISDESVEIGNECDISFSIVYNKNNNTYPKAEYQYVLTGVLAAFDKNGNLIKEITSDGYVNLTYKIVVDDQEAKTVTELIRLDDLKETSPLYSLKSYLVGKTAGDYEYSVYSGVEKYEYMREFTTYSISKIEYFTVNEIIVSFAFQNASERDPYYGETFYENKLLNENRYYGLNAGACEAAVKLLGGIGSDQSSSAAGLVGETVAIGLSAYNMDYYDLYAHKIYFELPRMIYDASEGTESDDDDVLSDYDWVETLGFTLYISDAAYDENGNRVRYIGSDMYDVVAKVSAKDFDFVEYGFTDFWARKSLVMMDITKLEELKIEFDMVTGANGEIDFKGSYTFDIAFETRYSGYVDGEYVLSKDAIDGLSPIKHQIVNVTASSDAFDTKFTDMFERENTRDLAWLYGQTLGGGNSGALYPGTQTTLGAAYFNSAYSILQLTSYLDNLTEAEQALGFTRTKVMSLRLKVAGQDYYYTYDFYRIDDRRVMVALYRSNAEGQVVDTDNNVVPESERSEHIVSDYYVDTFAFKKLVNTYVHLLNGQDFDDNIGYPAA